MTSTARLALSVTAAVVVACGSSAGSSSPSLLKVPVGASPQRGPLDAWVTMVEFADFQCSFCRAEEPVVADLATVYGADLRLVFKNLPLAMHDHARNAAVAAECAGELGKFWELHNLLLTTALDPATLLADAEAIPGLDVAGWQACIASPEAAAAVDADVALAASLGIHGTPTFVVNGVLVVGAVPEDELRAVIDQARARAIASGIPRADYYDRAVLGL